MVASSLPLGACTGFVRIDDAFWSRPMAMATPMNSVELRPPDPSTSAEVHMPSRKDTMSSLERAAVGLVRAAVNAISKRRILQRGVCVLVVYCSKGPPPRFWPTFG